jgi:hypothetical protein
MEFYAPGWSDTGQLQCRRRVHTVCARREYWMDASRADRNNPQHAERIPHREIER